MNMNDAFAELVAQQPKIVERGYVPIYYWEPDETVPISTNLTEADRREGWDHIRAMEDIALAYLVVAAPHATGQIVIYAKWPLQGWSANPWCKRHLIRHLMAVAKRAEDTLRWYADPAVYCSRVRQMAPIAHDQGARARAVLGPSQENGSPS